VRVLVVLVVVAAVLLVPDARPTAERAGDWVLDAGIYGTYNHFGNPPNGPPTYLCGIAFDLRYVGNERIESLDIAARFPDEFRTLVQPGTSASGWQRAMLPASGHGSLIEAALWKHAGGAVGAICPNGPSDLPTLVGTQLRVDWHSASGDHEQLFSVDLVRGEVTLCGGYFTKDGQIRPVWGRDTCG